MLAVFAPTDAAFAKLDSETTTFLTSDEGIPTLKSILQYHVLEAVVPSSLVATGSVTTMQGDDIDITVSATTGTVMLNGVSTVTETDLLANNG